VQVVDARHYLLIQRRDQVAWTQAGLSCRATRFD
jgi:hypothetical protein